GIISIVSNVVVMGMFARFRVLRTHTNYIIMNLAVTDIGVSSVGYPLSAASDLHGSWRFGWTGCQCIDYKDIQRSPVYHNIGFFGGLGRVNQHPHRGPLHVQVYAALNIFFGMASIGLLTVVAVDRYLVV
uniref:G-protein coupled receptors family 1 profile domain-containing protein n=1 Tax=Petromyzon marinus TaxID=7757 RepID=S4RU62_PETMA